MNPNAQNSLNSELIRHRAKIHANDRWQVIPNPPQWKAASATSRFNVLDRRGSQEIQAIDECVGAWDSLVGKQNPPTTELWEAAVHLFEAIEVYLATPRGHKQTRLDAVKDLRVVTMATLSTLRWKKLKEVSGGFKHGMKPMVQHVWSEMHSPDHARVGHGEDSQQDPDAWLRGENGADEKYLFEHLRKVRAEQPNPDNVLYIEDSQKWKYQMVFSENGLAYERSSASDGLVLQYTKPISTIAPDNLSTSAYAVDEDANFYTETSHHDGSTINHCSFLSGRPVMCAGNIGITNGIVGYIDNGSGHYRPSVANLLRALKALQDQVSPLYFNAILVRNHAGRNPMAVYLAGKFLSMKGNCLPIGYYKSASSNTHYKRDLIEFKDSSEIPAFLEGQDTARQQATALKELNALTAKLEMSKGKDNKLSGKLNNDDERRIMQTALQMGVGPGREMLLRFYVNDQPMLDWEKRQTYGRKIRVTN